MGLAAADRVHLPTVLTARMSSPAQTRTNTNGQDPCAPQLFLSSVWILYFGSDTTRPQPLPHSHRYRKLADIACWKTFHPCADDSRITRDDAPFVLGTVVSRGCLRPQLLDTLPARAAYPWIALRRASSGLYRPLPLTADICCCQLRRAA